MRKKKMITTKEFAEATNTPYPTVARWAQNGVIPGVEREETLRGPVWLIPAEAVDNFEDWKPKMGRPHKASEGNHKG
jgi:excisionase family DNA binding protein